MAYKYNPITGNLDYYQGSPANGPFLIVGSTDTDQLTVRGVLNQSLRMAVFEASDGSDLITFGSNGSAVFNEQGNDADFRIEGDTDVNLFFLDASTDRVGFGTNTPGHKLDIADNTANYSFRIINLNSAGFGGYIYTNSSSSGNFGLAVESAAGTILNVRNDGRVGIATNAPNEALEVVGNIRADGLRLDITPTSETVVQTHTITISANGTNYKLLATT